MNEPATVIPGRAGILLVNLGTPEAPKAGAVRTYLREFLSDPRVIEKQDGVWPFVLNGIILPFRPRIKARSYRKIWNTERDELPLKTFTRSQAEKLAQLFGDRSDVLVDWAMRYGFPSIASRFESMVRAGCDRILVLPLYPQYSAATTATVADEVFRVMMKMRAQPALRIAQPYYNDAVYIDALASSLTARYCRRDLAAGSHSRVVPRHAERICRQGRSLLHAMRDHDAVAARAPRPRRPETDDDVPVAFRPHRMAAALHRQDGRGAGEARREEYRHHHAGIFRGLP